MIDATTGESVTGSTGMMPLDTESADDTGEPTGDDGPLDAGCVAESCDGVDNDCDGQIDEGCDCIDGTVEDCFADDAALIGVGECVAGSRECFSGMWTQCTGEVLPTSEACNGLDDDCDGSADEDYGEVVCGEGICMNTVDECPDGEPVECVPGQPAPAEICNQLDDDCDGDVDELDCSCLEGETQDCFSGPAGKENTGECMQGTQACVDGTWGPCVGDVTPVPDTCDGLDNDCDGTADEGDPGGGNFCNFPLPGLCSQGQTACTDGSVVCEQVVFAVPEACDGLDNDCDTGVDEGNPGGGVACATGLSGPCGTGSTQCQSGALNCIQTVFSTTETCNGVDDDCDGGTDEGNPGGGVACSTGLLGACGTGQTSCSGGSLDCVQTVFSSPEICNGIDDDCDGAPDDGASGGGLSCPTGLQGVCATGISDCSGGSPVCNQTVFSSPETCDGLDNDCDGTPDDGNPGGGGACSTGLNGVCSAGTLVCSGGALVCQQNVAASNEVCDGLDNDCDGTPDENNPGGGGACATGLLGVCAPGTQTCSGGSLICIGNQTASPEVCDGLDNDCNGTPDNGNPGSGASCSTGLQGVCAAGTQNCSGGTIVCTQNTASTAEVCGDGLDNDCDGVAEEGCCFQYLLDGGFEAGQFGGVWTESSLLFGTPICSVALCSAGGGSGARSGTFWNWLGGSSTDQEVAFVSQDVTIPVGTATLSYYFEIPVCATVGADFFEARIDGMVLYSTDINNPACDLIGYVQQSYDVSAFADGGTHTIEFYSETYAVDPNNPTNFFVDDVSLQVCNPA